MNQREKAQRYDARYETLKHAQQTSDYLTYPGRGIPMRYVNGRIVALPGWLEADRVRREERKNPGSIRRRKVMTAKQEIEHDEENHGKPRIS